MMPNFDKVHNRFRLNGNRYNREDLKEVAYSFIKEGLHFEKIIGDLFGVFLDRPECMPNEWQDKVTAAGKDKNEKARVVCDYIAGMTDRYAKVEHARLFDLRGE
ncbi:MAG: hypothetical protein COB76_06830 [Alphaproteobacteria bacterium]|nr:MAG: hypothetical protein COB76_06830 [Alphaproteobacteria bacterium]